MNNISRNGKALLIALAALWGSSTVSAAGFSGSPQVMDSLKVHDDGNVSVVGADGDWNNPDRCGRSDRVVLAKDNGFYREYYAAILAAHTMSREVRFRLNGCIEMSGNRFFPEIDGMDMY